MLKLVGGAFDVFVTVDRNLSFQQNLGRLQIAVLVLHARSNRFKALLPLVPKIRAVLATIKRGELVEISA